MRVQYIYTAFLVTSRKPWDWNIMEESKSWWMSIPTDGGFIIETDSMGREKFWEDLGRPEDE